MRGGLGLLLAVLVLGGCAHGPPAVDGDSRPLAVEPFANHTLHPEAGRILAEIFRAEAAARGWVVTVDPGGRGDPGTGYVVRGSVTEFGYRGDGSGGPAVGFTVRVEAPREDRVVWAGSYTGAARSWTGRTLNGVATETVNRALTAMAGALE